MTASHERPVEQARQQMSVEEFEELERNAPELVRLEFLAGKLGVKAGPGGVHGEIIMWLIRRCVQARPELGLYPEQGLVVASYRKGRARPDAALAPLETFAGQGEWASTEGVLMTVEITSYDEDTDRRDREEKPRAYAESGIPVYLLIDRDTCEITVHAEPVDGRYTDVHTVAFGKEAVLPDPVGFTLETEKLKDWVR